MALAAEKKVILSWNLANFAEHQEKNKMKLSGVIEVKIYQYFQEVVIKLNAVKTEYP
ncbi:hypothetical protein [Okeania sp. SIO2B3]|uniref:hypothetical protein n=1 Tax=Okeania sp. SIO2B3 TaxID=2607784 RepID=UPI0013C135F4|nr:hypothetical protein [Okeania sp. SIO2B3]NET41778.1 hypothetical protein [Okeania sp. SIO2B3]